MVRNPCPHCGQSAVPLWRKFLMVRSRPYACRGCGQPVKVSSRAALVAILVVLAYAALASLLPPARIIRLATVAGIAAVALAVLSSNRLVPLEKG